MFKGGSRWSALCSKVVTVVLFTVTTNWRQPSYQPWEVLLLNVSSYCKEPMTCIPTQESTRRPLKIIKNELDVAACTNSPSTWETEAGSGESSRPASGRMPRKPLWLGGPLGFSVFLPVLEVARLRSRCWWGCFLLGPLSGLQVAAFSPGSHQVFHLLKCICEVSVYLDFLLIGIPRSRTQREGLTLT